MVKGLLVSLQSSSIWCQICYLIKKKKSYSSLCSHSVKACLANKIWNIIVQDWNSWISMDSRGVLQYHSRIERWHSIPLEGSSSLRAFLIYMLSNFSTYLLVLAKKWRGRKTLIIWLLIKRGIIATFLKKRFIKIRQNKYLRLNQWIKFGNQALLPG